MTNSEPNWVDGDDPGLVGYNKYSTLDAVGISRDDFNSMSVHKAKPSLPNESTIDQELDKQTDEWLMQNDPSYAPYGKVPQDVPSTGGNRAKHKRHKIVDYNGAYGFCRRCQSVVRVDRDRQYLRCGNQRKERQSKRVLDS